MSGRIERRSMQAPAVPRWLRPKLRRDQQRDTAIIVYQKLADLHQGVATVETLWDMARDAFTFSCVAELLGAGHEEMLAYLELITRLIERYGATGRVEFTSQAEDELARLAARWMEDLAEITDRDTAVAATMWSEACVDALCAAQAKQDRKAA